MIFTIHYHYTQNHHTIVSIVLSSNDCLLYCVLQLCTLIRTEDSDDSRVNVMCPTVSDWLTQVILN